MICCSFSTVFRHRLRSILTGRPSVVISPAEEYTAKGVSVVQASQGNDYAEDTEDSEAYLKNYFGIIAR